MRAGKERRRVNRCSFCGKGEDQVRGLLAGPGVYICDQCVELGVDVLREGSQSVGTISRASQVPQSAGRESPGLATFGVPIANLLARGMRARAIGWCLMRNARSVEVHVVRIRKRISAELGLLPEALQRQDLYRWLAAHGQLWTNGEVEAMVARAASALDSAPRPPDWLRRYERERLEKHLADERAMLDEAHRAVSASLSEDN